MEIQSSVLDLHPPSVLKNHPAAHNLLLISATGDLPVVTTATEGKTTCQGWELKDPDLLRRVNELRRTDNYTNWFYLAREYLFLAAVVGSVIAFYYWLDATGHSLFW